MSRQLPFSFSPAKKASAAELTMMAKWGYTQNVYNIKSNVRWWCWCRRRHWAASKMWNKTSPPIWISSWILFYFFCLVAAFFGSFVSCVDAGRCHRKIIIIDWSLMPFCVGMAFFFFSYYYFALVALVRVFVAILRKKPTHETPYFIGKIDKNSLERWRICFGTK